MREQEYRKRVTRRRIIRILGISLAVLAVIAVGIWNALAPIHRLLPALSVSAKAQEEVRVHFLDVGQGDCTVIELTDGRALVVDAGDGSFKNNNHILQYLKGLQVTSLILAATHSDADHCGGFSALLEDFDVETLYYPVLPSSLNAYQKVVKAAEKKGCQTDILTRYDVIAGGGAYAVCVSPYSVDEREENDSSAVLYFSYAGVNLLLGADITGVREERLLREYELFSALGENGFDSGEYRVRLDETDILKVSHHGSESSSSWEWLEMLSPETAIISCGKGNSYGHPNGDALERLGAIGADIYRTDELGDIMITISPNGTYKTEYHYL